MNCTVERTKQIRHETFDLVTGERTPGREETKTEPCRAPLFTEVERETGVCRACASGWTHPGNYPTTAGRDTIRAAGGTVPEAAA